MIIHNSLRHTHPNKVIQSHNGVLFNSKKGWSTDTCYNMNESQNHDAKRKKPNIKDHKSHESICEKCSEQANSQTENRSVVIWGLEREVTVMGTELPLSTLGTLKISGFG